MFDCLRELSDIIAHYERLSLRFQEEMDQLPPGCLLTRTLKNAERFYHQFRLEGKTKQVYLNAGAAARLRPLMERKKKIRRFLRAWRLCRPALRQIVRLAERLLANEELRMALLELYADSPSPLPDSSAPGWPHDRSQQEPLGRQAGGPADGLPPEIRLAGQPQRFYSLRRGRPPYPERLTMTTASGRKVRSKSEIILADRLDSNGLTYFYEPGLCLDGLTFHPDFLIRRPGRDDYVLWEHRGLCEDNYLKSWIEKVQLYRRHGIMEGSNLIVSYDSPEGDLDSYALQKQIEFFFLHSSGPGAIFTA